MKNNKGKPLKVVHRKENSSIRLSDKRNAMAVVNRLPSREAAKIMELFINSISGRFSPAVAHICTECGFGDKKQYYRGRKRLEDLGYITVDSDEAIIYVEFDALLRDFAEIKRTVVPHGNDAKQDDPPKPGTKKAEAQPKHSMEECNELMLRICPHYFSTVYDIYNIACRELCTIHPDPDTLWTFLREFFAKELGLEQKDTHETPITQTEPEEEFEW